MGEIDNKDQGFLPEEMVELKEEKELVNDFNPSDIQEDNLEKTFDSLELSLDEIIALEGDIPSKYGPKEENPNRSNSKRARAQNDVCFECDDIFDSESIHLLLQNDFYYYRKYKRYNTIYHFNYNQEPFSYMYEKKCWDLKLFDKIYMFLRQKVYPLNSSPFSASGHCSFFEFETLYSPCNCDAYVLRSHDIVKRNFERFERAALSFNADFYDSSAFAEIIDDFSLISIPSPMVFGKSINIVDKEKGVKDEIPSVDIDRSNWPSDFLSLEDFPLKNNSRSEDR